MVRYEPKWTLKRLQIQLDLYLKPLLIQIMA